MFYNTLNRKLVGTIPCRLSVVAYKIWHSKIWYTNFMRAVNIPFFISDGIFKSVWLHDAVSIVHITEAIHRPVRIQHRSYMLIMTIVVTDTHLTVVPSVPIRTNPIPPLPVLLTFTFVSYMKMHNAESRLSLYCIYKYWVRQYGGRDPGGKYSHL